MNEAGNEMPVVQQDTPARKLLIDFMVSPQFLTHPARHADQVEAAIAFTIARLSGDSCDLADRPTATNRVCTVCTAEVAAWPGAMCCHCQTMPWKRATPSIESEIAVLEQGRVG